MKMTHITNRHLLPPRETPEERRDKVGVGFYACVWILDSIRRNLGTEVEHDSRTEEGKAERRKVLARLTKKDLVELTENHFMAAIDAMRGYMILCEENSDEVDPVEVISSRARKAAKSRARVNPIARQKAEAMQKIHDEWIKRKGLGKSFRATSFAKEMAKLHGDVVTVEHIKNKQTSWSRDYHPAR